MNFIKLIKVENGREMTRFLNPELINHVRFSETMVAFYIEGHTIIVEVEPEMRESLLEFFNKQSVLNIKEAVK